MPATDSAAEIRWAIAQYLGFWLMLTAVVLALISQALQVAIAVEGMKGVMPDDSETPDAPQQGMLSPLSLAGFVAGLVILAVGAGLLLLSHLGAQAVNQNSNWGGVLDANKVGDITGSTISLGLLSGVIAFVVGGGFALVPALFISGRRIRAVAESLLRIPTALPPAMLVIALVEVGLSPGAMSARIALILALAPLAAVMVFQTLEAYRRGPYVKDKQNRLPQPSLLNTARALDLVGTLLFIIAVAMGAYTIVFVFGGNVAGTGSADTKVPTLGSYLMYALTSTQHGVSSGPAWNYYLSHVTLVVAFTLLAFICRLLAEGAGRLAVIKRG